jgi:ribose transport system permease protein
MPDLQQAVPMTPDADASTEPVPSRAGRVRDRVKALPKRTAFWIGVIDVLLVLFFTVLSKNHVFLSLNNFQNVTLDAAEITLLSAGEALLLGAGLIDISLPATLILASVAGGRVLVALSGTSAQVQAGVYPHLALGIIACVVVCVAVGALVGLVNGLVVTRLKVNSLIATLAVWSAALGLAQVVSGATDVAYIPTALQSHFGDANLFGVIPYPVFLVGVLVFGMWWALTKTKFGIRTLAIGSSREAAVRAGLRVERQELALLVLVGALAGVAGFLDLSHFADTNISGHTADALEAISGAVIGGTSLFGGVASIGGAVLGALLAQILNSGLVVLNVQPYYQLIVIGVVLVAAVYFDSRRRKTR